MSELQLKIVTEAPTDGIVELYKDAGWWEEGWSVDIIPQMVKGSFRFAALYKDDLLVGMGRALSDGVSDAYIQDIVVRTDLRGQGWGGKIVRLLVDELRAAGIDWIGLIGVPESDEFYSGLGFARMHDFVPMKYQC